LLCECLWRLTSIGDHSFPRGWGHSLSFMTLRGPWQKSDLLFLSPARSFHSSQQSWEMYLFRTLKSDVSCRYLQPTPEKTWRFLEIYPTPLFWFPWISRLFAKGDLHYRWTRIALYRRLPRFWANDDLVVWAAQLFWRDCHNKACTYCLRPPLSWYDYSDEINKNVCIIKNWPLSGNAKIDLG